MIRYFRTVSFIAVLAASITPLRAGDQINLQTLALPNPQAMLKEQEMAEQKRLLGDLETGVIMPLVRMYSADKYGIQALHDKLAELKKRAASGEDIGLEVDRLKADAGQVSRQAWIDHQTENQRRSELVQQRAMLTDLESRQIMPLLKMHGPDKYGAGALYNKLAELKRRGGAGEDIGPELGKLKADAELAASESWADYKKRQGWKW